MTYLVTRQLMHTLCRAALLLLVAVLLGRPSPALAGTDMCSGYLQNPTDTVAVIDGNDPFVQANLPSSSFGIDMNCEFRNFPVSPTWPNGLEPTLNFYTPDKTTVYLIVFDNVWYSGNMACSNIDHKLWVVNSEEGAFSGACQNIMIPAETIDKQVPASTATIGLPFTYSLTIPSMNYPFGDPSPNNIGTIVVSDDLNATGVDLTVIGSPIVRWKSGGTLTEGVDYTYSNTGGLLTFSLPNINAGLQLVIDLTVVLDDTLTNQPGVSFTNTATWHFSRWIDLNEDGVQEANEYFNPLPGESGISAPMTIVAPTLVVNKSSTSTAINLGDSATFSIDAQNSGGGDAWNATIVDTIPVGMCDYDLTTGLGAAIYQADGINLVKSLTAGTDYSLTYSGCQLTLTMTDTAGPIGPTERLLVTYQTELDPISSPTTPLDGTPLTNVAGATRWYSADSSFAARREFTRTLSDGTPTLVDHQDSQTVTAALSGYYFEKTVQNLSSLANPATTAAPGDSLRYRLRVFNVDQSITGVVIDDTLDPALFDTTTFGNVQITAGAGYSATWTFDSGSGQFQLLGAPDLNVDVSGELAIEFDISLQSGLANGTPIPNQAILNADSSFNARSDDPYVNGVAAPDDPSNPSTIGDEDSTVVTIQVPGPLSKTLAQPSAAVGEQFEYFIAVPAAPSSVPLYDVEILDTLPTNLRFVSARAVSGGTWTINNSGTDTSLILADSATGIDIAAGTQAEIAITVELLNTLTNQDGVFFSNSATYNYNRANGVSVTNLDGESAVSPPMGVTEPLLTATKAMSFVAPPGKPATDPATVSDILEYTITVFNNGTSTAFDVNIVDTLPASVALVANSATASIAGAPVSGFVVDPSIPAGTTLVWGRENGDGTLDIPAGQALVLTYQVTVVDATSVSSFTNSAYVDWTSVDEDFPIEPVTNPAPGRERTGAGCGTSGIILPNDYCTGPASVTVLTEDNTSLSKSVFADSYAESPPSTGNPVVRVGDTVTYDLTLNLQEYTTRNVVVEDTLPTGLALQSSTLIGGLNLTYTPGLQPLAGDTGTLRWELGDIVNTPDGDSSNDTLVIRYVAQVVSDASPAGIDTTTSQLLDNLAMLSYSGGDPALFPGRLTAAERIEVLQPQMRAISKVDLGSGRQGSGSAADPYQVNLASDTMRFELSSCNDGLAPAYTIQVSDLLADELDEGSLSSPVVSIDGTLLAPTADYNYVPPAGRGGSMSFDLNTPVNPGSCFVISYRIGFHDDISVSSTWSNEARLVQYASLPAAGRIYTPTDVARVWMTNQVAVEPLSKSLRSPVSGYATIGEQAVYQITVPGAPVNAALDNVVVNDTLHNALGYVAATATLDGAPLPITTVQSGQDLSWAIPTIPAGQQAIITLSVRVANNDSANAGVRVVNRANYTFDAIAPGSITEGSAAPLTIVEPNIAIAKSVSNVNRPGLGPRAGDILRYRLTFRASGGSITDDFSYAFDLRIEDSLGLGMSYVSGSASVNGIGNTISDPTVSGDGSITPQNLTWDLADATADIDIPEGTIVTVSYDVLVLNTVVAGQVLDNSVIVQWTGLDGINLFERTGSSVPAYNDYVAGPVSTSLIVGDDNSLEKAIIRDSYVDAASSAVDKIVRIGDIVTYRLTLNLAEGTSRNVTLQDVLPTGMTYIGLVGISPPSGGRPFTYTLVSQPSVGATGTLIWDLGDVVNAPSRDNTPVDALVIEYQAIVQPDAGIPQVSSSTLTNTAILGYLDANGNPVTNSTRLVASEILTVRQPLLSPVVKRGNGNANSIDTPLNVNVIADTVSFQLESCNTNGQAPAYGVQISDVLASQLDEASLSAPQVAVGGVLLNPGSDYSFLPPSARGGSLNFVLNTPVAPGECVTVDYTVGFHTDFGPNQLWNNSATIDRYWSLPGGAGQAYIPGDVAQFYMTNLVSVEALSKSLLSPASGSAAIGEPLLYQITVPGVPVGAALDNVVVSDTLHDALVYVDATATLNGAPLGITTAQTGQVLSWSFPTIPAGQQAVITLTARVANNDAANAGTSVVNTAAYTSDAVPPGTSTDGSSAPLTIVEPAVSLVKSVNPATPPVAGDILTYTVDLTAAGGVDNADAFDAVLDDTLSLGLAYVAGSARVAGAPNEPNVSGDGVATPQTLLWNGSFDILQGDTVTVSYAVQVLDTVVAGQSLVNSASVTWTSLDGASADERTGSGIPGFNDYVAGPVTTTLIIATPDLLLRKVVDKPVANPGDRLLYTLTIENPTAIRLVGFGLVDDIEALNAIQRFQAGSLGNVVVPPGASSAISGETLNVTDLTIEPFESLNVSFEASLATNLPSGSVVLNQAQLIGPWPAPIVSDDPVLPGSADPTRTDIPANGIVYDVATHAPLAGVTLTMLRSATSTPLPASCFIDAAQQNQTTRTDGSYKFDLVFDPSECPAGEDYLIAVTAAPTGYVAGPSLTEVPLSDAATAAYPVPLCPDDAVAATGVCEAEISATVPAGPPNYYLHLNFNASANQIYNNHIPVDQQVEEKIAIFKTTPQVNVNRAQIVPYTIRVKNTLRSALPPLGVVDTLPPGFKYVSGSARYDGAKLEPDDSGGQLRWDNLDIGYNREHTIQLLLRVGGGVSEGEFVNRAQVLDSTSGGPLSEIATATVRVVADPDFDCTDVLGKVFDDRDLDGEQGAGEHGLAGVRVVTARGLIATTDPEGRFHITCATVPDAERGSNFILKLDDRTLPTGYRVISENPRVQRATRGKALRFNFATALHRVVSIDVAAGVFEVDGAKLREVWQPRVEQLIEVLREQPSILRISYLADVEEASLVEERLEALRDLIEEAWRSQDEVLYRLTVETSVFWRRGKPVTP